MNKMNMDLRLRMLPAEAIIKNHVANDNLCNYELYLVELLNNLKYFSALFSQRFEWHSEQSNGECDAYAGSYGIDFKLAASRSKLHAKSILSYRIQVLAKGAIGYTGSKKSGTMQTTKLHAALRGKSLEELEVIRNKTLKGQSIESDIKFFMHELEKKKNMLLFFPYVFNFGDIPNYPDGEKIVVEAIENDFLISLHYREKIVHGYDTYFVTIYNDEFLIMKHTNGRLLFVDSVAANRCDTFCHLMHYSFN